MNTIAPLNITPEAADALWREYRDSIRKQHNAADAWLCRVYRAIRRKDRVLNIADAFRATGIDAQGRPVLAFMQADQKECYLRAEYLGSGRSAWRFQPKAWMPGRGFKLRFDVHTEWLGLTPPPSVHQQKNARTTLPTIPPRFRPPADKLHLYWLLWEAAWESLPVDPLLLRPLGGPFYTIVAQWNLTDAERAVLDFKRTKQMP